MGVDDINMRCSCGTISFANHAGFIEENWLAGLVLALSFAVSLQAMALFAGTSGVDGKPNPIGGKVGGC